MGALTAPRGTVLIYNGESLWSGKRKTALLLEQWLVDCIKTKRNSKCAKTLFNHNK